MSLLHLLVPREALLGVLPGHRGRDHLPPIRVLRRRRLGHRLDRSREGFGLVRGPRARVVHLHVDVGEGILAFGGGVLDLGAALLVASRLELDVIVAGGLDAGLMVIAGERRRRQ